MKTIATKDMFLRFLNELQQQGITKDSETRAMKIIEHLFKDPKLEKKAFFLNEISNICFIPPYSVAAEYRSVYEQYAARQLISFGNAISCRYQYVVWTAEKLLTPYATKCTKRVLELLHVQTKPNIVSVISHIHRICKSLQKQVRKNKCSIDVTDIMENFYECLKTFKVPANELKIRLSGTPLINIIEKNVWWQQIMWSLI